MTDQLLEEEYKTAFEIVDTVIQLRAPYRAFCHICNTPFSSLEALAAHTKDEHRVYKG